MIILMGYYFAGLFSFIQASQAFQIFIGEIY